MQLRTPSWQAKADAKVKDLQSKIPKEWVLQDVDLQKAKEQRTLTGSFMDQFLDKHELEILANDSVQLVASIQRRQYTAVEVVRSYCKAAAIAQQINNCLHEIMFGLAMQTARDLDRHYKETGNVKGPLHGLPVSLKDQFHVEGYDTTMGYVGWIGTYEGSHDPNKVHKVNSQVVKELLSLGAVLYCKVLLPLGLASTQLVDIVFLDQPTADPHGGLLSLAIILENLLLNCGSAQTGIDTLTPTRNRCPEGREILTSKAGEAALQALHASSVGLGTDIGKFEQRKPTGL
ncbi:MAG: hypothetical protein Q9224_006928, partial [Gallowayella concinna]